MRFTISNPIPQIQADLRAVDKQMRFAQAVALTRTAVDGKRAEVAEIDRAIDRPTPYTRNAVYVQMATKQRLVSAFGLKDDLTYSAPGHQPTNYLRPQIDGGQRNIKGFERLLQRSGNMPAGWVAVPGPEARIDAYGNVSRGQIIQILSQLRLQLTAGYNRNLPLPVFNLRGRDRKSLSKEERERLAKRQRAFVRAGGRFFVVKPGKSKLLPGIYSREVLGRKVHGPLRRVRAVFIFVPRASYRRRLDWDAVAERVVSERLDFHIGEAIDFALRTARP